MYSSFRQFCERLLRIPHDPTPPPGDEASTRIFRAAPAYYKYLLFLWGIKTGMVLLALTISVIVPAAVSSFLLTRQGNKWGFLLWLVPAGVILVFVLVSFFTLAILRLHFEKRWYVVTDRSLRIREGVVAVREMTVNFANIQNISISQGPLQRVLHIADLRVDTAGGGGADNARHGAQNLHTAWFRGIDNADEVRQLIQLRLRLLKDSGLGDHEELPALEQRSTQSLASLASAALVIALREVHSEACALRKAVNGSVG